MKSVAIIGGGITGLTAAFRLEQKGIPVTVYEANDRVGGVIQSIRERGYLAEFGPNTLLETSPKIMELIRAAGLEERCWHSDPGAENRYLVRGRRPIAMPGGLFGFLRTPLFSRASKWALFKEPFVPRWNNAHEESVAELVVRRLGTDFLNYAIDPMVAGVYAGNPARLSVMHAFPKLYAVEQKYGSLIKGQILGARERKRRAEVSKQNAAKISFDEGLQVLPDGLRARLRGTVHLSARVKSVVRTAGGFTVAWQSADGAHSAEHSAVLYSGTAHQLAELQLGGGPVIDTKPFSSVRYPAVASIVLGFRRADVRHPLDGFGALIPKCEGFNILGTLFSSSLFARRAPDGYVTLTTYVGGERNPDYAFKPEGELVDMVCKDLAVLFGVSGAPTYQHYRLYPKAIPQYEVGYGRIKDLADRVEKDAPGFFIAGNFRNGISLSDSLLSGWNTADRIETLLKQQTETAPTAPIHA
jgi:oxygen-dependent protoporphyrinogen oxidase